MAAEQEGAEDKIRWALEKATHLLRAARVGVLAQFGNVERREHAARAERRVARRARARVKAAFTLSSATALAVETQASSAALGAPAQTEEAVAALRGRRGRRVRA